jgi:arabinose-5-phosphate isomerase
MVQAARKPAADEAIDIARHVLQIEAQAIADLMHRLDESFSEAVRVILECRGRVVVCGIGKSGHIARKIASTLASTGTPASAEKEACPLNLAPTASTTAALALGDALAVALMNAKGFTEDQFARSHPGGALGRKLLTHVRDVMRSGSDAPRTAHRATLMEAMFEMSRARMGMTAVLDDDARVIGIFTDGDLRRTLEKGADLRTTRIEDVMSSRPRTIGPERLAAEAVEIMERDKVNQILVIDEDRRLLGALNAHDLFKAKVI